MASDDHVPIGTLLANQYRLTEIVGEGGMGVVYRARQETVGRDVAVKILRARHAKDEVVVRRFENEARIISQLRHPNTLRLYDTQRMGDGGLFIVTEFLQGQSLEQLLRQGRMPIDRVLSIADQICASLSEAHEMGVVHRDLKPGNIFLDRVGGEDFVKVLDFGIAKLQAGGIIKTQANVIMGTPAYMSPEQVKGEAADARSDIYAVGVLIYQMLAGVQPFVAENPVTILMKQVNDPPPPLAQKADVPPELEGLVFEMLSKHPDFRPQKITEVRDRLRTLARTLGSHLPPATPAMTPQPKPFQNLIATSSKPAPPAPRPQPTVRMTPERPADRYPVGERSDEMPTQPSMAPMGSLDPTLPPQPGIETSQIPMTIPIEMDHAIDASSPPALEMSFDEGHGMHRPPTAEHAKSGNRAVIIGAVAVVIVLAVVGLFLARPSDEVPISEEVAAPVTTTPTPTPAPDPVKKEEPPKREEAAPVKTEPAKTEPAKAETAPVKAETAAKTEKPRRKRTSASEREEDSAADDELERAASKILTEPAPDAKEEPAQEEAPKKEEEAPSAEPTPTRAPDDDDLKEDTKTSTTR